MVDENKLSPVKENGDFGETERFYEMQFERRTCLVFGCYTYLLKYVESMLHSCICSWKDNIRKDGIELKDYLGLMR